MDLLTGRYLIRQVFSGYSAPFFFMASHPFRSTLKTVFIGRLTSLPILVSRFPCPAAGFHL
jgi:hypothetical protein